MRFPFPVDYNIPEELRCRWQRHFEQAEGRDRTIEEGIWRRTQGAYNADESGWISPVDCRRRIIHYRYKFGLEERDLSTSLSVKSLYIYYSLSLPRHELSLFEQRLRKSLVEGQWNSVSGQTWQREDLLCDIRFYKIHPMDVKAERKLPKGYSTIDAVVKSHDCSIPEQRTSLPWDVLSRGIRKKDKRGNPKVVSSLASLKNHIPFQVEIGCGISLESGIPPLHYLHELYSVTDRDNNKFIFGGEKDDALTRFISHPEQSLYQNSLMMRSCLRAEPTDAHKVLKRLADMKIILLPIITNNFDGLPNRVGLKEHYIRRYDENIPVVPIYPESKALLVIGSHADRRRVQTRFRKSGKPIFFLDPEGFWESGDFRDYHIEGARDQDFICRKGAEEGLVELANEIGVSING